MINPTSTQVRSGIAALVLAASTLVYVADFEDYRGEAYIPVKGDVPTIGYGSTKGVKMGDRITPAKALRRLGSELEGVYADGLKKCIKVPLYDYEFSAYVILAYNVGVPTVCRKALPGKPPNLIDLINAERYAEACKRIDAFNKSGGIIMPGLVKRRAEERKICEGRA